MAASIIVLNKSIVSVGALSRSAQGKFFTILTKSYSYKLWRWGIFSTCRVGFFSKISSGVVN
mgnify:FL=1